MTGSSTTDDRLIPDTWPERVRTTVARLRKEVEKHPENEYYRLCLQGWEQELQRIEKEAS
jgi:hypothetical protein